MTATPAKNQPKSQIPSHKISSPHDLCTHDFDYNNEVELGILYVNCKERRRERALSCKHFLHISCFLLHHKEGNEVAIHFFETSHPPPLYTLPPFHLES